MIQEFMRDNNENLNFIAYIFDFSCVTKLMFSLFLLLLLQSEISEMSVFLCAAFCFDHLKLRTESLTA